MQEVPIEKLTTDMRLACRIRNAGGDIVAEAGELITENIISRCQKLGIYSLQILGTPLPGVLPSYDAERRYERIPTLFRNCQDNVFMRTLEAFLKKHFQERI